MENVKIHPSAEISSKVVIGKNTKIWNNVQIRENAKIGDNCIIGKNVYIDHDVFIGNNVKIQNNTSIFFGVTIEDGVFIGPHVSFTNDKIPRAITPDGILKKQEDWKVLKTLVKYGASIGANTIVLPNLTIGKWAMVGAGAVVTKDVPDYGLVFGNPARLVGYVNEKGEKVRDVK